MRYGLFFFASDARGADSDYRLLLEAARFADEHDFTAVWTPERHFDRFGGMFPDPSLTSAALAVTTSRVAIRAGSVVSPLHDPIRLAEAWSVVDNLSGGRVGVSFASGWNPNDFALNPDVYQSRQQLMLDQIETVRRLWSGEAIVRRCGTGGEIEVRTFPRPVQETLPLWLTSAGRIETFVNAGSLGANVLTHLASHSLDELAEKIEAYRAARETAGHDPATANVTLMLHTFLDEDGETAREQASPHLREYLRAALELELRGDSARGDHAPVAPAVVEQMLDVATRRYLDGSCLIGSPESMQPLIERLAGIGIDEIACFVDFGLPTDVVLEGLPLIVELAAATRTTESRSSR